MIFQLEKTNDEKTREIRNAVPENLEVFLVPPRSHHVFANCSRAAHRERSPFSPPDAVHVMAKGAATTADRAIIGRVRTWGPAAWRDASDI